MIGRGKVARRVVERAGKKRNRAERSGSEEESEEESEGESEEEYQESEEEYEAVAEEDDDGSDAWLADDAEEPGQMYDPRYVSGLETENARLQEELSELRRQAQEASAAQELQREEQVVARPSMPRMRSSDDMSGAGVPRSPSRTMSEAGSALSSGRRRYKYRLGIIMDNTLNTLPVGSVVEKNRETGLHFPHNIEGKGGRHFTVSKRVYVSVAFSLFYDKMDPASKRNLPAYEYDIDPEGAGAHFQLRTLFADNNDEVTSVHLTGHKHRLYDEPVGQVCMGAGQVAWRFRFAFTSLNVPGNRMMKLEVRPVPGTHSNVRPGYSPPFKIISRRRTSKEEAARKRPRGMVASEAVEDREDAASQSSSAPEGVLAPPM